MSGTAMLTVAEILLSWISIDGSCRVMTSAFSSAHTLSARTQMRAHLETRPNSRHLTSSRCRHNQQSAGESSVVCHVAFSTPIQALPLLMNGEIIKHGRRKRNVVIAVFGLLFKTIKRIVLLQMWPRNHNYVLI